MGRSDKNGMLVGHGLNHKIRLSAIGNHHLSEEEGFCLDTGTATRNGMVHLPAIFRINLSDDRLKD